MRYLSAFTDPLAVGAMLGALAFLALLLKLLWDDVDLASPSTRDSEGAPRADIPAEPVGASTRHAFSTSSVGLAELPPPAVEVPSMTVPAAPSGAGLPAGLELPSTLLPAAPVR